MLSEKVTYTSDAGIVYKCRMGVDDFAAQPTQGVNANISGLGKLKLIRNNRGFGLHPRHLYLSYFNSNLPQPQYVYRKKLVVLLQLDYDHLLTQQTIQIGVRSWTIDSGVGEIIR